MSTKTQVSCAPIASWISTAATEESTPPERPQITLPAPTCRRMRATASPRKAAMVQSPARPAIWWVKLRSIRAPRGVWATSGWNCTPYRRRPSSAITAKGEFSEVATTSKPSGMAVITSPWLIQTGSLSPTAPRPASSGLSRSMRMSARPNSR